jgi:hypothetical protein
VARSDCRLGRVPGCARPCSLPCFLSTALPLPTLAASGRRRSRWSAPRSLLLRDAAQGRQCDRGTNDLDGRRADAMLPRSGEGRAVNRSSCEADTAHARARSARPIHHSPPLFTMPMLGRAGAWWARRGRAAAGGGCGLPVRPGPRRRGRPRSGRPQAPLEIVEKFLTSIAGTLAKSS